MSRIILTAVGCPGFMEIHEALRKHYFVVGTDMVADCNGRHAVKRFYKVPRGGASCFLKRMTEIIDKEHIDAVLPEATPELIPLSKHPLAITSPTDSLKRVIDKGALLDAVQGKTYGPRFEVVDAFDEMDVAIETLGYPEHDIVLKPAVADGSRGLRILRDRPDYTEIILGKPTNVVTSWDLLSPMMEQISMPRYLVMEYLPGQEYSVDCIPELNVAVVRRRDEIRNGIAWVSSVIKDERISECALNICSTMKLRYNINIQFKDDAEGNPKLIEINPRVSGTIVACIKAGINLPRLAVKCFLGQSIRQRELKYKTGTLYRYWGARWT